MKKRRKYHGCGEEYNVEKREKAGSNVIFPIILKLMGRISSGEEGKGTKFRGRKSKIIKNEDGKEYKVTEKFIHHWPGLGVHVDVLVVGGMSAKRHDGRVVRRSVQNIPLVRLLPASRLVFVQHLLQGQEQLVLIVLKLNTG